MTEPGIETKNKRLKHYLLKSWVYFGSLLVVMAVVFCVFRAFTPWARQYKATVEQYLSRALGQSVTIQNMETNWYWFQPVLQLDNLLLLDDKARSLKLSKLLIGINIFSSILHRKLQPGILYMDKTHLNVSQNHNHWTIDGLMLSGQTVKLDEDVYLPILAWLSAQQKIIISRVSITVHLDNGVVVSLKQVDLTIHNRSGQYQIKGSATLDQKTPTTLSISADIQLAPEHLNQTKGRIYLSVHSFLPAQWQAYFPHTPVKVQDGKGEVNLWVDFKDGAISLLQSAVRFHHLSLIREGGTKPQMIDAVAMNLGWKLSKEGWELNGDHLNLQMNHSKWPVNEFFIRYNNNMQSYRVFVKHLLLPSLKTMDLPWPSSLKPILKMKLKGQLHDTELEVKEDALTYLLTGFSKLGWGGEGVIPAVSGLSGVVYWQPTEGRLELDSVDSVITPKGLPPAMFSKINMAAEWKPQGPGTRVSLENFVILRPDLTLTASGVVDELENMPASHMHLSAKLSANHAEQWLKYIPQASLKPGLNRWLKQDIKKIGTVSGQLTVDGMVNDFPFDKASGEFSILTYLSGVDLLITPKWPLSRDIDAYLKVDKRHLNADIQHADLKGIMVNDMNLRIDDVGLDYETLLIHGKINTQAKQLFAYVFDSPLNAHLSRLKSLELLGALGLDLKIEVPLYPENDTVLTQGVLALDNNQLILHHGLGNIVLDNLSGEVAFDEKGILESVITTQLAKMPMKMQLSSISKPKSATQIILDGNTTVEVLRDTLHVPNVTWLKGPLSVHSILTLPNGASELDSVKIQTSLQEVQVDLPAPLGKKTGVSKPLTANIDFNAEKMMKLEILYGDTLTGFLIKAKQLANKAWAVSLHQKDIDADVQYQPSTHTLSGHIARFHLVALTDEAKSTSFAAMKITPGDIPNLHLTVHQLLVDKVDVGQLVLDTTSTKTNWQIESCKITSPVYDLSLKGNWSKQDTKSQTEIQGNLKISNLGKSLQRFHIQPIVEANKGQVSFLASWPGSVLDFSLGKVKGDMQMSFGDGRITDIGTEAEQKIGLGKLFSILSLQTIPRRLKLDFSDLSKGGYSFDQFKGSFKLKRGVMNTTDSYIDGPVAYVSMKGDLDVLKHIYFLDLHVSPHVMASLPVVATIAGGPVAGIAVWAASKIINQGIYKVTGYTYKVTGPWSDPVIQQVDIYKKRVSE